MKRLLYIFPILLASCGQPRNTPQNQIYSVNLEKTKTPEKCIEKKIINFKEYKGKAILIGEKIEFLNNEFQVIKTLKEKTIVEIVGLSDSLFQKTEEYCDAFRYVKIRTDSQNGIIDERNIYQIVESTQDTFFNYKDRKFDIKTTSFFGISVANEEGLTFCSKYFEPVVLIENKSNLPRLIEIIKNDITEKVSWKKDFKYLELMANDGAYDKIKRIEKTDNSIILTIKRNFQDGYNEY